MSRAVSFSAPATRRILFHAALTPILFTLSVTLACTPDGGRRPEVVLRDSAGITVVENLGSLLPNEGGWAVSDTPLLSIGTVEENDRLIEATRKVLGASAF